MASSKIALMVLSQILRFSIICSYDLLSLVKMMYLEFFLRALPLIWMQDLRLNGVSNEMTRLHPGISKPSSVTLVVMRTLCSFLLNYKIFLIWLEYFSSTSSSTFPILEKYILAIQLFRVLFYPFSSTLFYSWILLLRNYRSDSRNELWYFAIQIQVYDAEGLDWKECPSWPRQTFCLLAQPVTPTLLQKFFSLYWSSLRYFQRIICRNLTVLLLNAKTSTISLTFCFCQSSCEGLSISISSITLALMYFFSHFPNYWFSSRKCFLSTSTTSFNRMVFSAFRKPQSLPSSLIMSWKPKVKANSPSYSHRSLSFNRRHSLISQKRYSQGSLMFEPQTSTLRQSFLLDMRSITSFMHRKYLGKCFYIFLQEVLCYLQRSKKEISSGINQRSSFYLISVMQISVWSAAIYPKRQTAKLESRFTQSDRSSLARRSQLLNGCETGEAVSPMIMGSLSLSSSLLASSNFLLFFFCSKQNSFMIPEQGWSPLQWWHQSNTIKEQSVILMQPLLRQFKNICEIMTVTVAFFISSRKVLREVMQLQIRFRLVIVWSSFFSPWMQMTWL